MICDARFAWDHTSRDTQNEGNNVFIISLEAIYLVHTLQRSQDQEDSKGWPQFALEIRNFVYPSMPGDMPKAIRRFCKFNPQPRPPQMLGNPGYKVFPSPTPSCMRPQVSFGVHQNQESQSSQPIHLKSANANWNKKARSWSSIPFCACQPHPSIEASEKSK